MQHNGSKIRYSSGKWHFLPFKARFLLDLTFTLAGNFPSVTFQIKEQELC